MPSLYVDPDDLKAIEQITATTWNDHIERCCFSASGAVDEWCGTQFALNDGSEDDVRVYTPQSARLCVIDDFASISAVEVDRDGDGDYELEVELGTDFVIEPANALVRDRPAQWLVARMGRRHWPLVEQGVQVTGRVGWLETPSQIQDAAGLLAQQLWARRQQTIFGVLGLDQATASRVLAKDVHMCKLLEPFVRENLR